MTGVSATAVFDREFLTLRGKLLEAAAALDRIDRAPGDVADPRAEQLRRVLAMLAQGGRREDRAEQLQMIFSLPYDPNWRKS